MEIQEAQLPPDWVVDVAGGCAVVRPASPPSGPVPDGQVRVEVESSSVNGSDARLRRSRPAARTTPGLEFAGTVIATGAGVDLWGPGDRIMGLHTGTFASHLDVPAATCVRVPDAVDQLVAGCLLEVFTTAHDALLTTAKLCSGDRLLVNGAAGGVGTAAVQLAGLLGAKVSATAWDASTHERLTRLLGPGGTVITSPMDLEAGGFFDVVLELVSGANLGVALEFMAERGRIVVIGSGAQDNAVLNLRTLRQRRVVLTGSTLKDRSSLERGEAVRAAADLVIPALLDDAIEVPIEGVYPGTRIDAAFDRFDAGGVRQDRVGVRADLTVGAHDPRRRSPPHPTMDRRARSTRCGTQWQSA